MLFVYFIVAPQRCVTVCRETMPDFFGKSGTPWVGTQFLVRLKAGAQLTAFYYDGFTNDKKEDSFSALSFLEIVQKHFFVEEYPVIFPDHIETANFYVVFLDGAGCFISLENLLTRIAFGERMNVYMLAMFIPECYFNKTSLDGHFATAGKQMRAAVSTGVSDAYDAASMLKARTSELATGIGATNYAVHFQPNRDRQCHVKKVAHFKVKCPLSVMILRFGSAHALIWICASMKMETEKRYF